MRLRIAVFALALAWPLFTANPGQATTLSFDFPTPAEFGPTYTAGGFILTNSIGTADAFATFSSGPSDADPSPTSGTILANRFNSTTTLTAVGGATFSLATIDFADTFNNGNGQVIDFVFDLSDGTQLFSTVMLDTTIGLQTVAFGVSNITSVKWIEPGFGAQFDNIHVEVTPIPAALPLFASALGGLGFAGWKRRRKTSATD
jgi:hypothetical protein